MKQNPRQQGFTLLEITIVVAIIGLIIGGVLVARGLLEVAAIRSLVNQQAQLQSAVTAYIHKYSCVPGDCESGADLGFTTATGVPMVGNNNGMIGPTTGSVFEEASGVGMERTFFWEQISQSKLWPHAYVYEYTVHNGGIPGGAGVFTNLRQTQWWAAYSTREDGGNIFGLFGKYGACGYGSCGGARFAEALTPKEARDFDEKIDDGMPNTGLVTTASSGLTVTNPPINGVAAPNGCQTNNTPLAAYYDDTHNRQHCNLLIRMQATP